jgi:anti-anti-sigma regulatory factor
MTVAHCMCERATPVLKISIVDTPNHRRLTLEGRLVAPWTVELKRTCQEAKSNLQNRELVIDLRCLTAISEDGEKVLHELLSQGIRFRCFGVFTKLVMKQLSDKNCQEKKR